MLLPIGGHKGSGLALVLGLLAGPLNGAAFGRDVVDFNADDESETNTGHFILALDVARFTPLADFQAEMDRHIRDLRGAEVLAGAGRVRLPGDRRAQLRAERNRDGIPVGAALAKRLDALASELDIAPLLP